MSELKKLEALLSQGAITRRDFLARASALGATAAIAPSLLIGEAQAATPKKGGHFKVGIGAGSTTDSLDPGTSTNTYSQFGIMTMHNHLTEVDSDGNAVPDLAEMIDASPDARVWTVQLRKGVTFHNGKELDAADVIASYNYHRGDTKSAAKSVLEPVAEMKADGKHTIVFTLTAGNADFPYIMSDYHIPIMPSSDGKVQGAGSIGLGAYRNVKYEPGVVANFERFSDYWKDGVGHFDSVETIAIKDVAARTNALATGEIHAMDRCDLKTVHLLKRNKKIRIEQVTGTQHYSIPMITTNAPFNDNNVRMALKHAVDREALVKTILRGYGQVANDHPISPANKFFNKELAQHTYDPDKAKSYLKKSGLSSLKVDLSAADAAFAGAVDASVLYKEHAAKAGIDINIVRESDDGYWSNVWMKKNWSMCYWGGRPTEDWMFSIAYAKGANWNDTFWDHDRFNELLIAARAELNESKRREMYYEMQDIVSNEGGVVVPMYASYVFATKTEVAHNKLASNWDLDGNKGGVRWWFA